MKKPTDPATSGKSLVVASLFVTAFEMLRNLIKEKVSEFLCEIIGFDKRGGVTTAVILFYREAILDCGIAEVTNKKDDF